jgi:phage N-6-adenine-methyltransferase
MNRHEPMLPEADVRETPPELFAQLDDEFNFNLDVCATPQNAKVQQFYTEHAYHDTVEVQPGLNGLTGSWKGSRAFVNPPYSDIPAWLMKAWESEAELVVMLIPSTRTEQGWWQDGVEPFRDGRCPASELPGGWTSFTVRFLRGRPRFLKDGVRMGSPKFGCCVLVWKRN